MTQALIVLDAQNEFSSDGQRPVPNHESALARIREHVTQARAKRRPIAWVRHSNKPHESKAFVPGTWGAELSPGLGPRDEFGLEALFEKDVFGAFAHTGLEQWLRGQGVRSVLLVGFYAHMCLSTSAREALVRGFEVFVDPEATGACELEHAKLGRQTADEVRRSTLLHLTNMGARILDGSSRRMTRRAALLHGLVGAPWLVQSFARPVAHAEAERRFAKLEAERGGRLGVAVLDVESGIRIAYRANERFAMCSTFKLLAVALVLARVDRGDERLDRRVPFTEADLVTYSPVTKDRVATGMTVAELCEAAMTLSDNSAANLLLASFGGPAALTAYARSLGDGMTRLDRIEPDLNEAAPGDPRDTTTPAAMADHLRRIVLGEALSAASRERLTALLVGNKTGDGRLRAGFPKEWRVGDKTGTGNHGTTNDIGVAWPPGRPPLVVCAYYAESTASLDDRSRVLADVARMVASESESNEYELAEGRSRRRR